LSNIFIAIDEAHNLYRIMNQDLSINTIKRAQSEYPSSMFKMLLTLLEKEQTIKMDEYYEEMKELGQTLFPILQEQIAKDELKSINAYLAYYFLQQAQNQTLTSDTKKISLINPLPSIILNKVNTAKKIVLMSGSFEPLSSYQLLYGLVNSKQLKILANKKETNGRYFIVSNPTYNGKFENRTVTYYELIWKAIDSLFSNIPGHTIVFSPSYSYLNQLVEMNPTKFAVVENPELNINEATTMLVNSTKKLLLGCVAGGKISEGIEFTQNGQSLIKGVMITALPYPPPSIETDIVYDELSERYGEHLARNFTITIPTVQRLAQSFGRAIRSERDKAVHILLDSRGTRFSNEFDFERFNSLERLNKVVKAFFTTNNG